MMLIGYTKRLEELKFVKLDKIFYLSVLTNLGVLFSVSIIYSMYLWVFWALSLSYYNIKSKKNESRNRLSNVG